MMVQTGELLAADRNRALTGVGRPTDGSSHTIPFRRNFTARRVGTCQMTVTRIWASLTWFTSQS